MEVKGKIEIEVEDRNGNVKERKTFLSKSWVKNHIKTLYADIWACNVTVKDVNGNNQTYEGYAEVCVGVPGASIPLPCSFELRLSRRNRGAEVLIGSSDTPWNKDQYCLSNEISGSVMQRGGMEYEDGTEEETEPYIRLKREFTNVSGTSVTVREVGVFFNYHEYAFTVCYYEGEIVYSYDTEKTFKYMVIRDVLDEPITVEPEEKLKVKYTLYITY